MTSPGWTFITNHGLVLSYIFQNASHTAREIATHVGVTERTTDKIISDLEAAGYLERTKSVRRNLYSVDAVPSFGDLGWRKRILIVGLLAGQPVWTLGAIALVANFSALHRLIIGLRKD